MLVPKMLARASLDGAAFLKYADNGREDSSRIPFNRCMYLDAF